MVRIQGYYMDDLTFVSLVTKESMSSYALYCFQHCHNRLPLAGWLETTKMYSFPVLETRRPKWRCWFSFKSSQEESVFVSPNFWWHRHFLAGGYITPVSAFAFIWSFSSVCHNWMTLLRALMIEFKGHVDNLGRSHFESLNLVTSAKTLLPSSSHLYW